MVFEYGPLILVNAEKYLENTDVCATLHACGKPVAFDEKIVMGRIIGSRFKKTKPLLSNSLRRLQYH
ncbi:hypothetical protein V2J09_012188 [Rumex salicifolius]